MRGRLRAAIDEHRARTVTSRHLVFEGIALGSRSTNRVNTPL